MLHAHLFYGIISFQLMFIIIQWVIFKRPEYGWYIFYIFCITSYFTIKYLAGNTDFISIGNMQFNRLVPDKSSSFLAFGLYIKFGRTFLSTDKFNPALNRRLLLLENGIIIYSVINFLFVAITHNFVAESYGFAVAFGIAFILSMFFLFRLYSISVYSKYLIIGSLMVALGACLALYIGLSEANMGIGEDTVTVYLQCGVIADFIFLNMGLVVKTQSLQKEALEKQQAIAAERIRISTDLHDDMGSELSAIRLLSEMNTYNMNPKQRLAKISSSSEDLVQKMNEIVWALNGKNDSLQNLVSYIHRYAVKYLDDVNIDCDFHQPKKISDTEIDGSKRRSIFLLVKESLNNIVKHADATAVHIHIEAADSLHITIHDNGKGMPENILQTATGNGLRNMQLRIKELKGKMEIKNATGTSVHFKIPFFT